MLLRMMSLLAGIWFCSQGLAAESRGLVSKVDLESSHISIDGSRYPVDVQRVQVFYHERRVDIADVLPATFVRYSLSSEGWVEKIWLIGSEDKLQKHFQH